MANFVERVSFKGKTAFVTGAAGIIGSALCEALIEIGAAVVACDKESSALKEMEKRLNSKQLRILQCDISNREEAAKQISKLWDSGVKIDVLYNNAATKSEDLAKFFSDWSAYPTETWDSVMSVNLDGLFAVTSLVASKMKSDSRGGAIINVASIYGVVGPDPALYEGSSYLGRTINTPPVYAASKGGVIALTTYFASVLGEYGIRVNSVTPGGVESGQNDQFLKNYAQKTPLRRMAKTSEIVDALIFLGSDAASYITGHNLVVDGGFTAR